MTKSEIEMKVSVEQVIHQSLMKIMKDVFDKYGVRVDSVDVSWLDISTAKRNDFIVTDIRISTTAFEGWQKEDTP